MQWGVPLTNPEQTINPNRYHYTNQPDEQSGKRMLNDLGEDGNHYYTEYSQVSAIETGFKKLKTNQIEILKELKKQYEVLKNSSMDSRIGSNNKSISESESYNGDSNSISQSDAQSSLKSNRNHSRSKMAETKELRLVSLEKKQLEIMLGNSMKKIQELLHNEIELKKNILELRSKIQNSKMTETQYDILVRRSKESEELLVRNVEDYKR